MRGEWIEIAIWQPYFYGRTCLSPCGESGLKLQKRHLALRRGMSLPMRGEWIEIFSGPNDATYSAVSPHAGRVD